MVNKLDKTFDATLGNSIINQLIDIIIQNRDHLSDIDGAIGDGDHGINMAKGFLLCRQSIGSQELLLSSAFQSLSDALMEGIGGSMGPLYGCFFTGMADVITSKSVLNKYDFALMLEGGLTELRTITTADVGDKCLMDTLVPAVLAFRLAIEADKSFEHALLEMKDAAEKGKVSTIDLIAKIGRASRLGERSKGVQDAGATSCWLLLSTLADAVLIQIRP